MNHACCLDHDGGVLIRRLDGTRASHARSRSSSIRASGLLLVNCLACMCTHSSTLAPPCVPGCCALAPPCVPGCCVWDLICGLTKSFFFWLLLLSVLLVQHCLTASWDDLTWLRSATTLPIVLKGVQCGEDAVRAARLGLAGIVRNKPFSSICIALTYYAFEKGG